MFSQKNNSIVGIIAEYNPFHNGHAYLIEKAKEITGADYCIVVMSGDFTQRGTPALFDKYIRTKMALTHGADLVIELPLVFATSSAEGFAHGGVDLLNRLNCVDYLCFGSESGSLEELKKVSDLISTPTEKVNESIKTYLQEGKSYPIAREMAYLGKLDDASILRSSNNILACEYLKAISNLKSNISPVTVLRKDNGYTCEKIDASLQYASASSIRESFLAGNDIYKKYVSSDVNELMSEAVKCSFNDFSDVLYARLLELSDVGYTDFLDVNEEISSKISKNLMNYKDIDSFLNLLKSKNITYTRISRCLLHILLGIKKEDSTLSPTYARILGFRKDTSKFLGILKENTNIELISKISDATKCRLLDLDIKAASLYSQINQSHINEYKMSPIII